ncbi:hypothetical protein J7L00_00545 [Candidatus Bathyarchaeota archaeon]|nr:hypothetical protein [Candidatus Bathyarchaeota archaeon]
MIPQIPIFGCIILGVALFFSISLYLTARRNLKFSVARMFLKKEESIKAMRFLVGGLSIFVLGRAIGVLQKMEIIPRAIYVPVFAFIGTIYTFCLIYSLYKLRAIIEGK